MTRNISFRANSQTFCVKISGIVPAAHIHIDFISSSVNIIEISCATSDRLCGLVVSVLGYRSGDQGSIPGTTRKKSNGSGTGPIQPLDYN
jgi:hypothetical protein